MGLVYHGVHKVLALELRDRFSLRFFVETGTHSGASAAWAAKHFEGVVTIELNLKFYRRAKRKYARSRNIQFVLGDSRTALPRILRGLAGPALLWLDAHWSADLKYPRPAAGECPLLAELGAIRGDTKRHVVMIDDARYFSGRPPAPHESGQWPTLAEIKAALERYEFSIRDDVIVAAPEVP